MPPSSIGPWEAFGAGPPMRLRDGAAHLQSGGAVPPHEQPIGPVDRVPAGLGGRSRHVPVKRP